MFTDTAIVYVVDDDASVLRAAARLFRSVGLHVETFATAQAFLEHHRTAGPGCLILELPIPGAGATQLQQTLVSQEIELPIVFLTGSAEIPTFAQAARDDGVCFLPKPVDDERLLEVVRQAIDDATEQLEHDATLNSFRERVRSLTKREHEVMLYVVSGMLNKQIARHLGITETTVKVHRDRVIEKTQVNSVADLIHMCERSGVTAVDDD